MGFLLYLQVVTLSDIALADGRAIDPAIQSGTLALLSSYGFSFEMVSKETQCTGSPVHLLRVYREKY
jgi:hypothetical protein